MKTYKQPTLTILGAVANLTAGGMGSIFEQAGMAVNMEIRT